MQQQTYKAVENLSDLRYYDPKNVIISLKAKGKGKKDLSGFVINL
jgi:hypothetical protein